MLKTRNKIFALLFSVNLLFAGTLALAQETLNSSVEVTPCVLNCFLFEIPEAQNIPSAINLSDTDRVLFHFNYALDNQIMIRDLRSVTGWDISIQSSQLANTANAALYIPYTQIGIVSFNNSLTSTVDTDYDQSSVDDINDMPNIINKVRSCIHPAIEYPPISPTNTNPDCFITPTVTHPELKPFNQAAFAALDPQNPAIDNLFTWFNGSSATQSDQITIMSAPALGTLRPGTYTMGLGLLIKIPATAASTLTDGDYRLELFFTITT